MQVRQQTVAVNGANLFCEHAGSGETGMSLTTLPGDHAGATPSLYETLDDVCAFWEAAEKAT